MDQHRSRANRIERLIALASSLLARDEPVCEPVATPPAVGVRRVALDGGRTPRKMRPAPVVPPRRRLAIGPYAPRCAAEGNVVVAFKPYAGQTMNLFRDDFTG